MEPGPWLYWINGFLGALLGGFIAGGLAYRRGWNDAHRGIIEFIGYLEKKRGSEPRGNGRSRSGEG